MLVYSVISRKSFDILQELRQKIEDAKKGTNIPIIVVGNKSDMAHVRQVTRDEGIYRSLLIGHAIIEKSNCRYVFNCKDLHVRVSFSMFNDVL